MSGIADKSSCRNNAPEKLMIAAGAGCNRKPQCNAIIPPWENPANTRADPVKLNADNSAAMAVFMIGAAEPGPLVRSVKVTQLDES